MAAESIYNNRVGLTEISIRNFKGIKDLVTIPIRPITLLYGANSAGKSTIIHALAYLREIICNNNLDAELTEIGGESIRLGGFRKMVHNHNLTHEIQIGVQFSLDDDGLSPDAIESLLNFENTYDETEECEETKLFFNKVDTCGITVVIQYNKTENRPFIKLFHLLINGERITYGKSRGKHGIPALEGIYTNHKLLKEIYNDEIKAIEGDFFEDYKKGKKEIEEAFGRKLEKILDKRNYRLPFDLEITSHYDDDLIPEDVRGYAKAELLQKKDIHLLLYCTVSKDEFDEITDDEKTDAYSWSILHYQFIYALYQYLENHRNNISFPLIKPYDYNMLLKPNDYNIFLHSISEDWIYSADENEYNFSKFEALNGIKEIIKKCFNGVREVCISQINKLTYIGPVRVIPDTLNSLLQGETKTIIGDWASGKAAWEILRRDFNSKKAEPGSLIKAVNEWMNGKDKLDLGYKLDISHNRMIEGDDKTTLFQLAEDGREYVFSGDEIFDREFEDEYEETWVKFTEWYEGLPFQNNLTLSQYGKKINLSPKSVGVGITQIVPILTAASYREIGLVTVEQPELHLHPKVQCNLSDVFIESIRGGSKSYILESHSEHLLLRLQRRIKEKKLHPSDVSILFIEPANPERGSEALRLRLDEEGKFIDDWPDGFFEEGYEEIFAGL